MTLTPSERHLMLALMQEPGLPVTREALVKALGHDTEYFLSHRLDMLISRLRSKVRDQIGIPLPVKALRGVGFTFSPDD